MTKVHCHADCAYMDKATGMCDKPDVLIAPGGFCVSVKTGADTIIQSEIINDIRKERLRQDEIWGQQNHLPQFWTGILGEEYGELCEAINETVFANGQEDIKGGYENMRKEAVHVAAVALAFIECLERNRAEWFKDKPHERDGGDKCVHGIKSLCPECSPWS